MDYSADSLRYLHIAFAILIVSQVAYAIWLGVRWSRTQHPYARSAARQVDSNGV